MLSGFSNLTTCKQGNSYSVGLNNQVISTCTKSRTSYKCMYVFILGLINLVHYRQTRIFIANSIKSRYFSSSLNIYLSLSSHNQHIQIFSIVVDCVGRPHHLQRTTERLFTYNLVSLSVETPAFGNSGWVTQKVTAMKTAYIADIPVE